MERRQSSDTDQNKRPERDRSKADSYRESMKGRGDSPARFFPKAPSRQSSLNKVHLSSDPDQRGRRTERNLRIPGVTELEPGSYKVRYGMSTAEFEMWNEALQMEDRPNVLAQYLVFEFQTWTKELDMLHSGFDILTFSETRTYEENHAEYSELCHALANLLDHKALWTRKVGLFRDIGHSARVAWQSLELALLIGIKDIYETYENCSKTFQDAQRLSLRSAAPRRMSLVGNRTVQFTEDYDMRKGFLATLIDRCAKAEIAKLPPKSVIQFDQRLKQIAMELQSGGKMASIAGVLEQAFRDAS